MAALSLLSGESQTDGIPPEHKIRLLLSGGHGSQPGPFPTERVPLAPPEASGHCRLRPFERRPALEEVRQMMYSK